MTETSFPKPRSGGQVTGEHEALARVMLETMRGMLEESQVAVGTVLEDTGGKIRVQIDDESSPRQIGVPRQRGHRFKRGQRVPIIKAKGGTEFIGQSISSNAGRDPAVGYEDMEVNSVNNSILHDSVVNDIQQARNRAEDGISRADSALDRAATAKNRADDAYELARGKADKSHSHDGYASSGHNHSLGSLPGELATRDWVRDNFQKK